MSKGKKKKRNKARNQSTTYQSPRRTKSTNPDDLDRSFYIALRNFYNDIAPSEWRISPDTEFIRLASSKSSKAQAFGLQAFVNDIMFAFLGTGVKTEPEITLAKLVIDCGKGIHLKNPLDRMTIGFFKRRFKKQGYVPFDKKVLCVIQEKPTEEFLDKDQVIIDIKNEDYLDFAGPYSLELLYDFEKHLEDTDVVVKVINKVNHPRAFKDYQKLKKIAERIDG